MEQLKNYEITHACLLPAVKIVYWKFSALPAGNQLEITNLNSKIINLFSAAACGNAQIEITGYRLNVNFYYSKLRYFIYKFLTHENKKSSLIYTGDKHHFYKCLWEKTLSYFWISKQVVSVWTEESGVHTKIPFIWSQVPKTTLPLSYPWQVNYFLCPCKIQTTSYMNVSELSPGRRQLG